MASTNNYFNLTLDNLGPSGTVSRSTQYIKADTALTITFNDQPSGLGTYVARMKLWYSNSEQGTTSDTNYSKASWITPATSYTTTFGTDGATSGDYYYHLQLLDDVGNTSDIANTAIISYDINTPVLTSWTLNGSSATSLLVNDKDVAFVFNYSDVGSGVKTVRVKIEYDSTSTTKEFTVSDTSSYSTTITMPGDDGAKTISVQLEDKAGNTSTYSSTKVVTVDTEGAGCTWALYTSATKTGAVGNYTNTTPVYAAIDLPTGTDIAYVAAQVSSSEPSTWTWIAVTDSAKTAGYQSVSVALSSEGSNTVWAAVKDAAGNITVGTSKSFTYDKTAPVATFTYSDDTSTKHYVSNINAAYPVSGTKVDYSAVAVKVTITDATSDVASWTIKAGSEVIQSGTTAVTTATTYSFTKASVSAGAWATSNNTLTLTVVDNAGNTTTKELPFEVDLTIATPSVAALSTWYNATTFNAASANISFATDTGSGYSKIFAWTNIAATTPTSVPDSAYSDVLSGTSYTLSLKNLGAPSESASNYLHVAIIDNVGNVAYNGTGTVFGYDTVAPTATTFAFAKQYYNTASASLNISASDATSKVAKMKIWGNIVASSGSTTDITYDTASWVSYTTAYSVTLNTSTNGTKTVYLALQDNAGNTVGTTATPAATATTIYDNVAPTGSLKLYENDGTTSKASVSADPKFVIKVTIPTVSEGESPIEYYQVFGDFGTGTTAVSTGTSYDTSATSSAWRSVSNLTVSGIACTVNDEENVATTKTIKVAFKDAAGNMTAETACPSAVFSYITGTVDVVVSNVDYNRISYKSSARLDPKVSTDTNNKMTFVFTPNRVIVDFKICAFDTAAEANAATDPSILSPIGTTHGSKNVVPEETPYSSDAAVTTTIMGEDFGEAIGATTTEPKNGLHYVVAYVKDASGNWSAACTIPV